jgi:rubrerythrin/L-lactate utilization protein LutC
MENVFRVKKFRDVSSQTKSRDVISGTLDSIHQTVVSSLKDTNIDILKDTIDDLNHEIDLIKYSTKLEDILRLNKIQSELDDIHKSLEEESPVESYYLKNADIMLQYYGTSEKTHMAAQTNANQNTFMKYLSATTAPETSCISKKELFEKYANRMKFNVEPSAETITFNTSEHCEKCNVSREEIGSEGILVCPVCGSEEYMLVVSDFPSFRDPPKERTNYAYKKINHLNEILNQFQAKESTIIPDEVMHEVICEIKKRRIQNIADMTEKDMREILKKLNRSKYYEHATHILSRLNGNPPPTITPEIEEKIRAMFQEIQAPFLLYCPDERTNFLSYSYILYKFFELLELDEYKVYFPLLKSRDRLIAHDDIWKKICDYLKWEFISSV